MLDREEAVVGVFAAIDSDNEEETMELLDEHARMMAMLAQIPPETELPDDFDKLHRRSIVAKLKQLGSDLMDLGVEPKVSVCL